MRLTTYRKGTNGDEEFGNLTRTVEGSLCRKEQSAVRAQARSEVSIKESVLLAGKALDDIPDFAPGYEVTQWWSCGQEHESSPGLTGTRVGLKLTAGEYLPRRDMSI